ncbi:P-II family nitrogen regulator [Anaerostipes sp. MSJ-23]|uniref:P-II family nitrogen regulator n=1 Tax=Anaerostipes sp. MSJ-23 TaxID=2841520 RepID=UPI0021116B57|nr:P-II family nitrogen regulator [Anaerostipes sp. MSJ-23]
MELLPKQLIMVIVENNKIEELIELVKKELYTGHIGDGKIFISPISNIIRVRTGETGKNALE